MPQGSTTFHESEERLSPATRDMHRAIVSLTEELEARQLRDVLAAVHRSPVIREAGAVFSTRGGDFVITIGGDLATGYRLNDRDAVHLFCVETVAPQAVASEAVCVLEA